MIKKTKLQIVICTFCIWAFISCQPLVHTHVSKSKSVLDYREKVQIFSKEQSLPEAFEVLGYVEINDNGFTLQCDYGYVIYLAQMEARKLGGNALRITSHRTPNFWNSCHRITADILRIDNTDKSYKQ